jgi:PilZ domain
MCFRQFSCNGSDEAIVTHEPDPLPAFDRSSSQVEQAADKRLLDQASAESVFAAKRRFPRFLVDIPVKVQVSTQGPTRVVSGEGQGTDLSLGGLAVSVDLNLAVGDQIAVEFSLPCSEQSISFRCFVRNRHGASYGVEFITENDDDYRKTAELHSALLAMNT